MSNEVQGVVTLKQSIHLDIRLRSQFGSVEKEVSCEEILPCPSEIELTRVL